ncbi:uncharacterized protein BBOV_IV002270 [Babesia bovis T2Bo]|uniref:Uncharacterized protein n=1 Tax=Babesia bovis TaxID=5865 RepID=A7AVJ8_BABBO|nr:uncharacterized protein BBOV_IV002270 [Babesia bovis T2Bo]EDO05824.1 hypothetical protein BBOV_IV002270 [Babesia bovis T2Bo]|eukprot:XP_001609392.1 hypothetical protein [Babesia bovis T2Bo]
MKSKKIVLFFLSLLSTFNVRALIVDVIATSWSEEINVLTGRYNYGGNYICLHGKNALITHLCRGNTCLTKLMRRSKNVFYTRVELFRRHEETFIRVVIGMKTGVDTAAYHGSIYFLDGFSLRKRCMKSLNDHIGGLVLINLDIDMNPALHPMIDLDKCETPSLVKYTYKIRRIFNVQSRNNSYLVDKIYFGIGSLSFKNIRQLDLGHIIRIDITCKELSFAVSDAEIAIACGNMPNFYIDIPSSTRLMLMRKNQQDISIPGNDQNETAMRRSDHSINNILYGNQENRETDGMKPAEQILIFQPVDVLSDYKLRDFITYINDSNTIAYNLTSLVQAHSKFRESSNSISQSIQMKATLAQIHGYSPPTNFVVSANNVSSIYSSNKSNEDCGNNLINENVSTTATDNNEISKDIPSDSHIQEVHVELFGQKPTETSDSDNVDKPEATTSAASPHPEPIEGGSSNIDPGEGTSLCIDVPQQPEGSASINDQHGEATIEDVGKDMDILPKMPALIKVDNNMITQINKTALKRSVDNTVAGFVCPSGPAPKINKAINLSSEGKETTTLQEPLPSTSRSIQTPNHSPSDINVEDSDCEVIQDNLTNAQTTRHTNNVTLPTTPIAGQCYVDVSYLMKLNFLKMGSNLYRLCPVLNCPLSITISIKEGNLGDSLSQSIMIKHKNTPMGQHTTFSVKTEHITSFRITSVADWRSSNPIIFFEHPDAILTVVESFRFKIDLMHYVMTHSVLIHNGLPCTIKGLYRESYINGSTVYVKMDENTENVILQMDSVRFM